MPCTVSPRVSASAVVIETIHELHPGGATIDPGTELGAGGLGLDSIQVLELVLNLEARLGARFRNEDLDEDALRTVGGLITYVDAHVG